MRTELGAFQETTSTDAFASQNPYLLKVRLDQGSIQAKSGSMVAYQGDVTFEHVSGGVGKFIKKAMTGEGQRLMSITGSGEVFLADTGKNVHVLYLENETITVNGSALLALDADLEWDVQRVKGGAAGMMAGGLFNTTIKGTGYVALLTDGPPVLLDVASAPTFADAQAAVAWSGGVTTTLKTDIKAFKAATGRASGESFQIAFAGTGWVIVQPSEGPVIPAAR
ncbi:MAG: AIM24 family protein [Solirubrobacteraceae bacterium]|nr:AIM24 family protein [Solirubrobacteraceae bacterium]